MNPFAVKGAVMTATHGLAKELRPAFHVNSICPRMFDTEFHKTFTKSEPRCHVADITPLKREGTRVDVANLATYFTSDETAFIARANIDFSGGMAFS